MRTINGIGLDRASLAELRTEARALIGKRWETPEAWGQFWAIAIELDWRMAGTPKETT